MALEHQINKHGLELLLQSLFRFPVSLLRVLERFRGVFESLLGLFVSADVVSFSMMGLRRAMGVGCQIMKFCRSAMGIVHLSASA